MSGRRIELSTTHVIASVLAAVSAAILASFLGVADTIIGAAVVSFASTSGTAVYRHFLRRTEERLRTAAAGVTHRASAWGEPGLIRPEDAAARDGGPPAAQTAPVTELAPTSGPTPTAELAPTSGPTPTTGPASTTGPAAADPAPGGGHGHGRDQGVPAPGHSTEAGGGQGPGGSGWPGWLARFGRPGKRRWLVLAGATVLIFVLAMLGVTLLEAAAGKPVDALVWGRHNTGTTVGNAVSGSPRHARSRHPHPTPAPSATPSATRSATPTPSPSASGSRSPGPSPSTSPTPSATPSVGATRGGSPAPAATSPAPAAGG